MPKQRNSIIVVNNNSNNITSSMGSIKIRVVEKHRYRNLLMDEFFITFYYTFLACSTRGLLNMICSQVVFSDTGNSSGTSNIQQFLKWSLSWVFPFNKKNNKNVITISPGYIFSSSWLLLGWGKKKNRVSSRNRFIIPNLPTRVCETMLGRYSYIELAVIVPIHFSSAALAMTCCKRVATIAMFQKMSGADAFEPIIYSSNHGYFSWIVSLFMEICANTLFCIPTLVLPELFILNSIPLVLLPVVITNFMNFANIQVDSAGALSSYSPNLLYALYWINNNNSHNQQDTATITSIVPWEQSCHWMGPLLGGVLSGFVMKRYFPDNDSC